MEHLGIDVHQKYSEICWLSESGEVRQRRRLPTTEASLRRFFGRISPVRVVLESSCVTPSSSPALSDEIDLISLGGRSSRVTPVIALEPRLRVPEREHPPPATQSSPCTGPITDLIECG